MRDEAALGVCHLVGQAAGLAAVAAVGAAAGVGVADVALAAVGHAQRAVDEELDVGAPRRIHWPQRLVDGGDLLQRQFARQHDLRQAHVLQKARFLGRADVGLGAGVQLDGRQVDFQQAHVLDDQRVGTGVVHLPGHLARGLQLVVAQDGVQGDEDAAVEAVRVLHQALDVADVVARTGARAKGRAADVDGIGAVVDGFDADVGIARGREQFELVGQERHGA